MSLEIIGRLKAFVEAARTAGLASEVTKAERLIADLQSGAVDAAKAAREIETMSAAFEEIVQQAGKLRSVLAGTAAAGGGATRSGVSLLQGVLHSAGMRINTVKAGTNPGEAVAVAFGDMTKLKVDAYVVPHFQNGASFGGVGAAVCRGGANIGMTAYERIVQGLTQQQAWGEVRVTASGGGNSEKLIHAVSVGSGKALEAQTVETATLNALEAAKANGINSVAFPALGTGVIGELTAGDSARAILQGIERFRSQHPGSGPKTITIAIYGDMQAYAAFAKVLQGGVGSATAAAVDAGRTKTFSLAAWLRDMSDRVK